MKPDLYTINLILPVGISFYTFHGLSYVIDVYRGQILPERNFNNYALFVSFFPLLVAGPIERATHLLPQVKSQRTFDYLKAVDGLRQILWGLFKKVVIADSCSFWVNQIFDNYTLHSGSTLIIGAVLFAFQIYGDFSGYSDIAMGTAKMLGFDILRNFAFPYFSRSIAEFWRRWHISLSTWFRDYVYIPLGGSKGSVWMKIRNTLIIFLISGFWHGANWTFVMWGLLNALYIIPSIIFETNRKFTQSIPSNANLPKLKIILSICFTFFLTVIAWIFFRSSSISNAFEYVCRIFQPTLFSIPSIRPKNLFLLLTVFILIEWYSRNRIHCLEFHGRFFIWPVRWTIYLVLTYMILFNMNFHEPSEFIYFQF